MMVSIRLRPRGRRKHRVAGLIGMRCALSFNPPPTSRPEETRQM